MMFLITKMFVYLVLAGGIGVAAGWLLRNLQAQQSEEASRRSVADAKSKVPQLESLLRGRDEQIAKLKDEIKERRQEAKALADEIKAAEKNLLEQRRETNKWKQSAESKVPLGVDGFDAEDDTTDGLIAELSKEITDLKAQLAASESAPAPSAADHLDAELDASRLHNRELERALEKAEAALKHERATIVELERERELQNKSLQVLHQQLDLERDAFVAGAQSADFAEGVTAFCEKRKPVFAQ